MSLPRVFTGLATAPGAILRLALSAAVLLPLGAQAQPTLAFSYRAANGDPVNVAPGGRIEFPTVSVGSASSVEIKIHNSDAKAWTLQAAGATGAAFSGSALSLVIPPRGFATFSVLMRPPSLGLHLGTLTIRLSGPSGQSALATFPLSGASAGGVITSYALTPDGDQAVLNAGAELTFPRTSIHQFFAAAITVSNRTDFAANVGGIVAVGEGFSTEGLPSLPLTLAPGMSFSFTVKFAPDTAHDHVGELQMSVDGRSRTYRLAGEGSAIQFGYDIVSEAGKTALEAGGTVDLGTATVDETRSGIEFQVHNTGNLRAYILSISVSNRNFLLTDLPRFPAELPKGGTLSFRVVFQPVDPGVIRGGLRIGDTYFELRGEGVGPAFTTTLLIDDQQLAMPAGATATLPNTQVGASTPFAIKVLNRGNQPGAIDALTLEGAGFRLQDPMELPRTLEVGESVEVSLAFAPESTGTVNGRFLINQRVLGLQAVGTPPPHLPEIHFLNVSEEMTSLEQPGLRLELDEAYPYPLSGRVTLLFSSPELGDDPAIKFITGTRHADFHIPAGETVALFKTGEGSEAELIPFQTGTTAGTIRLSAAFSIGSYSVTQEEPVEFTIALPEQAPVIHSVRLEQPSQTSFTLAITGYANAHEVDQLIFDFTPSESANLGTTQLTLDVSEAFQQWFTSGAGESFGGQFSVSIQFQVDGFRNQIESIGVSASNRLGTSPAETIRFD